MASSASRAAASARITLRRLAPASQSSCRSSKPGRKCRVLQERLRPALQRTACRGGVAFRFPLSAFRFSLLTFHFHFPVSTSLFPAGIPACYAFQYSREQTMRNALIVVVVLCCLLSFAQNPPAQPQSTAGKRPLTFEDMMQLKRINEPVPSPDGKWVAFSAVDVNLEDNTKKPHLWIVPLAGGEAQRLLQTT